MPNTPEYSPIYLEIVSALGKARISHTTKRIGTSSTAMIKKAFNAFCKEIFLLLIAKIIGQTSVIPIKMQFFIYIITNYYRLKVTINDTT